MVHRVDCARYSDSQICCLGWGVNFTDNDTLSIQLEKLKPHLNLEDIVNQNPEIKAFDIPPDLPKELMSLEVERILPKLSPLSSGGIE